MENLAENLQPQRDDQELLQQLGQMVALRFFVSSVGGLSLHFVTVLITEKMCKTADRRAFRYNTHQSSLVLQRVWVGLAFQKA